MSDLEVMKLDAGVYGTLILRKSEWLDNWFCVANERGEIPGASIEGTAADMLAILVAIEASASFSARRCAVNAVTEQVMLWSPRNSQFVIEVSRLSALGLASSIRRTLKLRPGGKVHTLKTTQPHFSDVEGGRKHAELRFADRDFSVGDALLLREFDPKSGMIGDSLAMRITHVLAGHVGLSPGYSMLSIERVDE